MRFDEDERSAKLGIIRTVEVLLGIAVHPLEAATTKTEEYYRYRGKYSDQIEELERATYKALGAVKRAMKLAAKLEKEIINDPNQYR